MTCERVLLSGFKEENREIEAVLNDTVDTPSGRVVVAPTGYYNKDDLNRTVMIEKNIVSDVVDAYRERMRIELADKSTTIIYLTLQDVSVTRAEDVINTLIEAYNEDAVNDKNQIAINTASFINERLKIIDRDLGLVDSSIASFKSEHRLTDAGLETGVFLQESSLYNQTGLGWIIN